MIEHRRTAPSGFRYWEYVPVASGLAGSTAVPTLVFLHGSGEHGDDLDQLKAWGLPKLIAAGLEIPCRVLCPQCPEDNDWDLERLAEWIAAVPAPVFLTGYSRGATAAWNFAARFGPLLAGVIPVASRWELADAAQLAAVPTLAIHGEWDERPSPAPLIQAIKDCGGEARLDLLAGEGHFIADRVYAEKRVYDWILERTQ